MYVGKLGLNQITYFIAHVQYMSDWIYNMSIYQDIKNKYWKYLNEFLIAALSIVMTEIGDGDLKYTTKISSNLSGSSYLYASSYLQMGRRECIAF